jgi:hypothetical protein
VRSQRPWKFGCSGPWRVVRGDCSHRPAWSPREAPTNMHDAIAQTRNVTECYRFRPRETAITLKKRHRPPWLMFDVSWEGGVRRPNHGGRSGPMPPVYTSVQMLEKRLDPATLCHFSGHPAGNAGGKLRSAYRWSTTGSDRACRQSSPPRTAWHRCTQNCHHYARLLFTTSMDLETAPTRTWM